MHPIESSYAAFVRQFRQQLEAAESQYRDQVRPPHADVEEVCLSQRAVLHFLDVAPGGPHFVAALRFAVQLQAWAAYRRHRQLYVVDERLAEPLSAATWPEALDVGTLFLPVPGTAISMQLAKNTARAHFIGFYDVASGPQGAHRQLRFVQLAPDGALVPCASLLLDGGRLEDALQTEAESLRMYIEGRRRWAPADAVTQYLRAAQATLGGEMSSRGHLLRQLLNVLLYIHGNKDVVARIHPGRKPTSARPRSLRRAHEKQEPTTFDVGRAFSATLEHWEQEDRRMAAMELPAQHVRPHVRRAHLHLYWTGKGRETPKFQLVRPTLVRGGNDGQAPATRRVR